MWDNARKESGMKNLKSAMLTIALLAVMAAAPMTAKAGEFAVVDVNKVVDNYGKAQEVTADLKVKESELQAFLKDAQSKIEAAKTPVEKQSLETKLGEQFELKRKAYLNSQTEKWQEIEKNITDTITSIAAKRKSEMVFNKSAVIVGGTDITEEVTKQLNTAATPAKK
jgi:outer membrane protein